MQTTIKSSATFSGVGLHTGRPVRVTIHPASAEYGMTQMGCLGSLGDLENAFMRVLDSASLVAMGPEMLVLLDGEGDKLAEFALRVEAP